MNKWSGKKLLVVIIACIAAVALFTGMAVAAVDYFNNGHDHHGNGEYGTCYSGREYCNFAEECHEEGDCLLEEQCQEEGDCHIEGLGQEEDHDCFEEHPREGERDSLDGNRHGCR